MVNDFTLRLALILLPRILLLCFYTSKFHRRFIATWHLIPLIALWGGGIVIPLLSGYSGDGVDVDFVREVALIGLLTVLAFMISSLRARNANVSRQQQISELIPRWQLVSILSLGYFTLAFLVHSLLTLFVVTFTNSSAHDRLLVRAMIAASLLVLWVSGVLLGRVGKTARQVTTPERPLASSDYAYLGIPIGMTVGASLVLILLQRLIL